MKFCLHNRFRFFLPRKFFVTRQVSKPILLLLAKTVSSTLTLFLFIEVFEPSSKQPIPLGFQSYPQLWITLLVTYLDVSFKKQGHRDDAKRG
jgi:hypothetical protein